MTWSKGSKWGKFTTYKTMLNCIKSCNKAALKCTMVPFVNKKIIDSYSSIQKGHFCRWFIMWLAIKYMSAALINRFVTYICWIIEIISATWQFVGTGSLWKNQSSVLYCRTFYNCSKTSTVEEKYGQIVSLKKKKKEIGHINVTSRPWKCDLR